VLLGSLDKLFAAEWSVARKPAVSPAIGINHSLSVQRRWNGLSQIAFWSDTKFFMRGFPRPFTPPADQAGESFVVFVPSVFGGVSISFGAGTGSLCGSRARAVPCVPSTGAVVSTQKVKANLSLPRIIPTSRQ